MKKFFEDLDNWSIEMMNCEELAVTVRLCCLLIVLFVGAKVIMELGENNNPKNNDNTYTEDNDDDIRN